MKSFTKYSFAGFLFILFSSRHVVSGKEEKQNIQRTILQTALPGVYHHLDISSLLGIPQMFDVDKICPAFITVSQRQNNTQFVVDFSQPSAFSSIQCIVKNGDAHVVLDKVDLTTENSEQTTFSDVASIQDLENHFLTFLGNFSNLPFSCPILNSDLALTPVQVRDTGYLYTYLNIFNSTGEGLGQAFDVFSVADYAPSKNTFSVSFSLMGDLLFCSYLPPGDKLTLEKFAAEIRGDTFYDNETLISTVSPTPTTSSESITDNDNGSTCFPSNGRVLLSNGSSGYIAHLTIGDYVKDGSDSFSRVVLFTHSDHQAINVFTQITTRTSSVRLTPSHYIYLNGSLRPAGHAKVGETVLIVKDNNKSFLEEITSVTTVSDKGLWNPQTESGRIAVSWKGNAIVASTYTSAIEPSISHSLLSPIRFVAGRFDQLAQGLGVVFREGAVGAVELLRSILLPVVTL